MFLNTTIKYPLQFFLNFIADLYRKYTAVCEVNREKLEIFFFMRLNMRKRPNQLNFYRKLYCTNCTHCVALGHKSGPKKPPSKKFVLQPLIHITDHFAFIFPISLSMSLLCLLFLSHLSLFSLYILFAC